MAEIVNREIETYMRALQGRHDEPILLEMEAQARERGFPIVGRTVGVTLELLARSIDARRIVELGSGFGYSGYWFSRAIGRGGELFMTDGDADNERKAWEYLGRAGLDAPMNFFVGDAVQTLVTLEGEFDVVYNDIDKDGYPEAWRAARERVRVGGLYICDNVLWYGRVAGIEPEDRVTPAIREHNEMIAADEAFVSSILPIRDGVMVALRVA
jgi:predicted O-methyltransferase YrrM